MSSVVVVITLYGGERWIEQTLRSAIAAVSAVEGEVVVVDDGSTDGGPDVVGGVAGPVTLIQQPNRGVAAARQRGFEAAADADAVLFLDQDDILEVSSLSLLRSALAADARRVAVVGRARFIDENGAPHAANPPDILSERRRVSGYRAVEDHRDTLDYSVFAFRNCIYTPGQVLVRAAAYAASGGFDSSTAPNDDWDLWLRLTPGGPIGVIDDVTTAVRRHDRNVSSDEQLMRTMEIVLRGQALHRGSVGQRRAIARGYRSSEWRSRRHWRELATRRQPSGAPSPFRLQLWARYGASVVWSIAGLRAHHAMRRAAGKLVDPRVARRS